MSDNSHDFDSIFQTPLLEVSAKSVHAECNTTFELLTSPVGCCGRQKLISRGAGKKLGLVKQRCRGFCRTQLDCRNPILIHDIGRSQAPPVVMDDRSAANI
jgi:hypothetical protein